MNVLMLVLERYDKRRFSPVSVAINSVKLRGAQARHIHCGSTMADPSTNTLSLVTHTSATTVTVTVTTKRVGHDTRYRTSVCKLMVLLGSGYRRYCGF